MNKKYDMIYLKDYQTPSFKIYKTELDFNLSEPHTDVIATLYIERLKSEKNLVLVGESLELTGLALNTVELAESAYAVTETDLTIFDVPDQFVLTVKTRLHPEKNLSLSGLYQSNGNYCTQCEAQGFRRITYYLDQPDNLSEFKVRIEAEEKTHPILLSNGNLINEGKTGSRHWAEWHDPFLKPSYLFALVAGDLVSYDDHFITQSDRKIDLKIYVEQGKEKFCQHAMRSLKKSMRWDEEKYGREYDLDIFMIVAVSDFNMGAMENKGLNIFNDKYILADSDTATDQDFQAIEGVIAHEYFHNWTGNRVTCRDWFQLSLKEGLTVFRDQEFSREMNSQVVNRIEDVARLKQFQFKEDSGPNAHPVQPDAYIEINNFYTATIYEKGAELIRMQHTLVGETGFRKGTDLYFERHDGQAVTIEDFVKAISDANEMDLSQFMPWYKQAGTPTLTVSTAYDQTEKTLTVDFKQTTPATPNQDKKEPVMIPIQYGLVSSDQKNSDSKLFILDEAADQLVIPNAEPNQVLSVLQGFSAPVQLEFERPLDDWFVLLSCDPDGVNRYEAAQKIYRILIQSAYQNELKINETHINAFKKLLKDSNLDRALKAKLLSFPSLSNLLSDYHPIDIDKVAAAQRSTRDQLIQSLQADLLALIDQIPLETKQFDMSGEQIANRALRNTCLGLLATQQDTLVLPLLKQQFEQACNMTDRLSAFQSLVAFYPEERKTVIDAFYQQWQDNHLVLDKWFSIQSMVPEKNYLKNIIGLTEHEKFSLSNPNRIRSVLSALIHFNPLAFHQAAGYQFIATQIKAIDKANPQIASRLAVAFENWYKLVEPQRDLMRTTIDSILSEGNLSKDLYEILSKSIK